ncbi:pseudouridine synthase [Candidatus Bathyarchaeota archaeon]|nr:pseudouridine synthase [Candidatus Bathyarchaeota archaeon]
MKDSVEKVRRIADYQFGLGAGETLFPDGITIIHSKRTGKVRYVYECGKLLATLKPLDGYLSLTIAGAKRLAEKFSPLRYFVVVSESAVPFVAKGGNVFAKYVLDADEAIRPRDEVIVVDSKFKVIAVGRAVLSGVEMKKFRFGVAVETRSGVSKEKLKNTR